MTAAAVLSDAVLSENGVYRYSLTRIWDANAPVLVWVGLNPSTADATVNDPTIQKEVKFSKAWGYGGLVKVNLFAFRSTDPVALNGVWDPIGPENPAHIARAIQGRSVLACWGASVPEKYQSYALTLGRNLRALTATYVLGLTKHGQPRHPLYMRDGTDPVLWSELIG